MKQYKGYNVPFPPKKSWKWLLKTDVWCPIDCGQYGPCNDCIYSRPVNANQTRVGEAWKLDKEKVKIREEFYNSYFNKPKKEKSMYYNHRDSKGRFAKKSSKQVHKSDLYTENTPVIDIVGNKYKAMLKDIQFSTKVGDKGIDEYTVQSLNDMTYLIADAMAARITTENPALLAAKLGATIHILQKMFRSVITEGRQ